MAKDDTAADERPFTSSIPKAGKKYFGLCRSSSYVAADEGIIPTISIGRKRLALVRVLERKLEGRE